MRNPKKSSDGGARRTRSIGRWGAAWGGAALLLALGPHLDAAEGGAAVKVEGAGVTFQLAENWQTLDPNYFNLLKTLLESRGGKDMRYGELLMMFQRGPREQFVPLQTPFMIVARSENIVSPQAILVAYFKAGGILKDGAKRSRDLVSGASVGNELEWDGKLGMLRSTGAFRLPTGQDCPFRGFTLPTRSGVVQFVIFDGIVPSEELSVEVGLMMSKVEVENSLRVDQAFVTELTSLIEAEKNKDAEAASKGPTLSQKWDQLWNVADKARQAKDPEAGDLFRQANEVALEALKTRYGLRAEWIRRDLASTVRRAEAMVQMGKLSEAEALLTETEKKLLAASETSKLSEYLGYAIDCCNVRKQLELSRVPPNHEGAIAAWNRAIDYRRTEYEINPTFENHWSWLKTVESLGGLQKNAGKTDEAEATYVGMIEASQKLLDERPHKCGDFHQLNYAIGNLTGLLDRRGAFEECYRWKLKRLDFFRLLTQTHPTRENWAIDRVRETRYAIDYGWSKKLEDWAGLEALYAEAFEVLEKLPKNEETLEPLNQAIELHWSRRDRLTQLNPPRREEAVAPGRKAVELERIRNARAPSPEHGRLLAIRLGEFGILLRSTGAREEAETRLKEACAIAEPLLKSGAIPHKGISNLHNYYGELSGFAAGRKEWAKALEYRTAREAYLRHRWREEEPETAYLGVTLAETLRGTGDLMLREKLGDPGEAEKLKADALAILEELEEAGTLTETGRTRLKDWRK